MDGGGQLETSSKIYSCTQSHFNLSFYNFGKQLRYNTSIPSHTPFLSRHIGGTTKIIKQQERFNNEGRLRNYLCIIYLSHNNWEGIWVSVVIFEWDLQRQKLTVYHMVVNRQQQLKETFRQKSIVSNFMIILCMCCRTRLRKNKID